MATQAIEPVEATISLDPMLAARDRRAMRQSAALARFHAPLVSVQVVTPGPIKDDWLPRRVMEVALRELNALYRARNWPMLWWEVLRPSTGPEAIHVMDVDAKSLKLATIVLEDGHPIGRLWNFDVITPDGTHLSRKQLGLPPRRCLICDRPAHECGRLRRHSRDALLNVIEDLVIEDMVNDIGRYRSA